MTKSPSAEIVGGVMSTAWLNTRHHLQAGAEIFHSERCFTPWAYTISHGQLLLRSSGGQDWLQRSWDTTVDVLFKPVRAMKIQHRYDDLTIRCATSEEAQQIHNDTATISFGKDEVAFVLETGGHTVGHVVSLAVGWQEGILEPAQPSFFAALDPDTPAWRRIPLFGVDAGLGGNTATDQQLTTALATGGPAPAERTLHRFVYVVMTKLETGTGEPIIGGAGVFLTREEAEDRRAHFDGKTSKAWIEALPMAI